MTKFAAKVLTIGSSVLCVTFLAVWLVVVPKYLEARELQGAVLARFWENQRIEKIILSSENPGKRFQEIHEHLNRYQEYVPPSHRSLQILDDLPKWAERSGLQVQSIKTLKERPYLGRDGAPFRDEEIEVHEFGIEMKLEGTYFSLRRYLTDLRKTNYKIRSLNIILKNPRAGFNISDTPEPKLLIELELGVLVRSPVPKT